MKSNDRFCWALRLLQIQPDDEVLEIGCGTGLAASMVAENLISGHIMAIDQSAVMISKAKAAVRSDKVQFLTGRLGSSKLPRNHFSKAFAFNVSSFWKPEAMEEIEALRSHLKSTGTFYLFHQPPTSHKTKAIAEKSVTLLEAAGFEIEEVFYEDIKPALCSCIIAKPAPLKRPKQVRSRT